jgi:uridylate kinase
LIFSNCGNTYKKYKKIAFKQKVLVGGGWKPGRSSDGAMIKYANTYGAATAINLSNIDYVYDKDPRKFKDAKPIRQISWKDYLKIVGSRWDPGKNFPFDPIAAKEAQ